MKNYKRSAVDREVTFNAPKYTCYACNDTGIINNSDKLINSHLPDYDIDDKGRRFSGQDLALISACKQSSIFSCVFLLNLLNSAFASFLDCDTTRIEVGIFL